jgi:hypothetical protein
MDRLMKSNGWLLAVILCSALAADPGLAARRGKSAPHANSGAAQDGQGLSHEGALGAAVPASRAPAPAVTDVKTGVDTAGQTPAVPAPPVVNSRAPNAGGKSAAMAHGIDLVRPDDGYANLRRRAARSSLVANAQRKKPQIVAPVTGTPHAPAAVGPTVEQARNSTGAPVSANVNLTKPGAIHAVPAVPANTGPAKNSLGVSLNETHHRDIHVTATTAMAPVNGVNGTTMGRVGLTGIGGPAKERSAIGGSAFRKF